MLSRLPQDSCSLQIATFRARILGPADILAELRTVFPAHAKWIIGDRETAEPAATFQIVGEIAHDRTYQIRQDGRTRWTLLQRGQIVPLLEWALTEAAVACLGSTALLFHAGAVARQGQGLLLPAASGSGKTTLTVALLASGFQFCSDEIGMLDPASGHLVPFPKRLCVKEGTYALLYSRLPDFFAGATRHQRGDEPTRYVDPPAGSWASAPVPTRFVVFPRYHAGSRTQLIPLSRSAALPLLLAQSFSARRLGPAGIARAVDVIQHAECYALTVGDLASAVAALQGLYDRPSPR